MQFAMNSERLIIGTKFRLNIILMRSGKLAFYEFFEHFKTNLCRKLFYASKGLSFFALRINQRIFMILIQLAQVGCAGVLSQKCGVAC